MITLLLLGGIAAENLPFLIQVREDAIYSVRGNPNTLRDFHAESGQGWTGGEVVDSDPADGLITYWAYSERSAVESRAFILSAVQRGLDFQVEEYREGEKFPQIRASLNAIAEKCEATIDPFFLTPTGAIEVSVVLTADPQIKPCLMSEIEKSGQIALAERRAKGEGN